MNFLLSAKTARFDSCLVGSLAWSFIIKFELIIFRKLLILFLTKCAPGD